MKFLMVFPPFSFSSNRLHDRNPKEEETLQLPHLLPPPPHFIKKGCCTCPCEDRSRFLELAQTRAEKGPLFAIHLILSPYMTLPISCTCLFLASALSQLFTEENILSSACQTILKSFAKIWSSNPQMAVVDCDDSDSDYGHVQEELDPKVQEEPTY
jgi:hypothetical protein